MEEVNGLLLLVVLVSLLVKVLDRYIKPRDEAPIELNDLHNLVSLKVSTL